MCVCINIYTQHLHRRHSKGVHLVAVSAVVILLNVSESTISIHIQIHTNSVYLGSLCYSTCTLYNVHSMKRPFSFLFLFLAFSHLPIHFSVCILVCIGARAILIFLWMIFVAQQYPATYKNTLCYYIRQSNFQQIVYAVHRNIPRMKYDNIF